MDRQQIDDLTQIAASRTRNRSEDDISLSLRQLIQQRNHINAFIMRERALLACRKKARQSVEFDEYLKRLNYARSLQPCSEEVFAAALSSGPPGN